MEFAAGLLVLTPPPRSPPVELVRHEGADGSGLGEPVVPSARRVKQSSAVARRNPLSLAADVAAAGIDNLNQLLADATTLRDLYKKHHWQASGPDFSAPLLPFDKHAAAQTELVDPLAERVQTLGRVSIAVGADVVAATGIPQAPRGREDAETQIARLLQAHEVVLLEASATARLGGQGRLRHERPHRLRRDPHQRVAGLVPRRARAVTRARVRHEALRPFATRGQSNRSSAAAHPRGGPPSRSCLSAADTSLDRGRVTPRSQPTGLRPGSPAGRGPAGR